MSEDEKPKARFLGNCIEDYEQEMSPGLRAIAQDFARQMAEEYERRRRDVYNLLKRHPDDPGLKGYWTPEQVEKFANGEDDPCDEPNALTRLCTRPFDRIEWHELDGAMHLDGERTAVAMTAIYEAVADYLKGGIFAADAVGSKRPYERAQFIVIRNAFNDEWKPRGGVEASLVDMLAQTYVAWQYWLSRSFDIANNEDTVSDQVKRNRKTDGDSVWLTPRLSASEYLERATQMAYRFQGMYMRTLRQMRDLRRYASPVVIQNAGQVNVAADGGQQVNVQTKKKKKGTKAHGTVTAGARRLKAVK